MSNEFIGSGWGFPVDVDSTGGIPLVSRQTELEQAIRLVISTAPGERPMRPEFGCSIHDHVFDPADGRTAGRIAFKNAKDAREATVRTATEADGMYYAYLTFPEGTAAKPSASPSVKEPEPEPEPAPAPSKPKP